MTLLLYVIGMTWAGLAVADASFPCAKAASKVEKLICESSNVHLMELDRALAREYREALGHAKAPNNLKAEQRGWLLERDKCLAERYTEERYRAYCDQLGLESKSEKWKELDRCAQTRCLAQSYRRRIKALTGRCYRDVEWSQWKGEPIRSGHWPLCRTFLDNLNRYCDEAPMVCEWKVHPRIQSLKLPKWERLSAEESVRLLRPNPVADAIKIAEEIRAGRHSVYHTRLDLDGGDGKLEDLILHREKACDQRRSNYPDRYRNLPAIGVAALTLDRMLRRGRQADPETRMISEVNEAVILFDGKPYIVGWFFGTGQLGHPQIRITEPSSGHFVALDKEGYVYGSSLVCAFEYLGD